MNCPNCNTPNEPNNAFCVNCGYSLSTSFQPASGTPQNPAARSAGEFLGIFTARLVIAVLGVWVIRAILIDLSFIEGLRIPDTSVTGASIVNVLAYLVIIALLVAYGRDLGRLWPQAFPGYPELGSLLVALVYTVILAAVYAGLRPFLVEFLPDQEVLLILQILLAFIVLIIVARAAFIAYQGLAGWLTRLIAGARPPVQHTAAVGEAEEASSDLE